MTDSGPGMGPLAVLAQEFAHDLTTTVGAVVAEPVDPFLAVAAGERVTVRQYPDTGIPLCVDGEPLLTLTASYRCDWDTAHTFLTVEHSAIGLYPGPTAAAEPVVRFDYVRHQGRKLPAAHVQVHGSHHGLLRAMAGCGALTKRARDRRDGVKPPALSQLHLPVGGHRLRPCLEDVLQMVLEEFGVDRKDGATEALEAGREKWRRGQVGAIVRDAPSVAVRVLTDLGYTVTPPEAGCASDNANRLRGL